MATVDSPVVFRCSICHVVYSAGERFCPLDAGTITPEGDSDPRVGRTIDGRYFVRRLIGRGGMGAVYEADHVGLDKRVAIKFLAINKTDRDALARFRREAKIASRIVHEHVVQIFDVGTADADTDYIVMEFLDGKDLAITLKEVGTIDPARTVSIARKVLRGLRAIHQAGIVHRDIKPANILLSPREEDRDFVKIMDFGISRQIHGDTITSTGAIIGTPEYMAPEQLLADDIDQRADIYAVGIMMFRMLTGRLPFTGETFDRAAAANPYVPVPSLDGDVPASLAVVIAKAVAKDADDRYQDAPLFLAALDLLKSALDMPAVATSPASSPTARSTPSAKSDPPSGTARTVSALAEADTAMPSGLMQSGVTAPAKRTDPRVPIHHMAPTLPPAATAAKSRTALYATLGLLVIGAAITVIVIKSRGDKAPPVATLPTPALAPNLPAGGPAPSASPSSGSQVKELLAKGHQAETAGKLEDAIEAYSAAYALEQSSDTIFQIAELQERVGNLVAASTAFQRYLHITKDPPDRDVVLARIAKLEKTNTKPAAGTVPKQPQVATVADSGLEDCHCIPKTGIPDTQSLCAIKGPSLCRCDDPGNNHLCSSQVTKCDNPGVGGCTSDGFACAEPNYDKPHFQGVYEAKCTGFAVWQLGSETAGKLWCDVCAATKKPRQFRGHHGDVCTGYYRHTGEKIEGRLWCKYP